VGQGTDGVADNDSAVIDNFPELHGGSGALVSGQIGEATHIDRIESAEVPMYAAPWFAQLITSGALEQVERS